MAEAGHPRCRPHRLAHDRNVRSNSARRQSLLRGAGGAARLRRAINRTGGAHCAHCHKWWTPSELEVDHIIELIDGGTDDDHNVQPLCVPCHLNKSRLSIKARKTRA